MKSFNGNVSESGHGGGFSIVEGSMGYRLIGGTYLDVATGKEVDWDEVYYNYVRPNAEYHSVPVYTWIKVGEGKGSTGWKYQETYKMVKGPGTQAGEAPNYTDRVGGLDYVGYVVDGTGYAAELTAKTTYKYGQRVNGVVKSAAQLTRENAALFGKVATRLNVAGAVIGVADCGMQSYDDFSNGNYALGTYEASKGTAYLVGLALCTNPVTLAAGLTVIGVTGIIDIAGDVGLYIFGKNR